MSNQGTRSGGPIEGNGETFSANSTQAAKSRRKERHGYSIITSQGTVAVTAWNALKALADFEPASYFSPEQAEGLEVWGVFRTCSMVSPGPEFGDFVVTVTRNGRAARV